MVPYGIVFKIGCSGKNMLPVTYKLGLIFVLIGLVIKIPAFILGVQNVFYFGLVCSGIGICFFVVYFVKYRIKN